MNAQKISARAAVARTRVLIALAIGAQSLAACQSSSGQTSLTQQQPASAAVQPGATGGSAGAGVSGSSSSGMQLPPAGAQPGSGRPVGAGAAGMAAAAPPSSATSPVDAGIAGAPAQTVPAMPPTPPATTQVLYWLDILANSVWRANADGGGMRSIASGSGISAPDGVSVDLESGYVYWTNMGSALGGANLGTLQRTKLDGGSVETVVPTGTTNTPKQMTIDGKNHKLYWSDREGAKVWRANMDGSGAEILASGHGFVQLVGIALDVDRKQFYFTDRMAQKIMRAGFEMPASQNADTRTDVEDLFVLGASTMPIDLDLDLGQRTLYWTDRMEGTVHRAPMDLGAGQSPQNRSDIETLASGLADTIGIALDLDAGQLYFSQLDGQLWRAQLDGSKRTALVQSGSATGVTVVRIPTK